MESLAVEFIVFGEAEAKLAHLILCHKEIGRILL